MQNPHVPPQGELDARLDRFRQGMNKRKLDAALLVDERNVRYLSGFTGADASLPGGTARFVRDDPEHVVIDVDAPARGFLVLADQYYPGWRATVNGAAVPTHRANQMFRLIEVPAGTSRVEFRYRPTSVAVGAAISLATLAVMGIILWRGGRRTPSAPSS